MCKSSESSCSIYSYLSTNYILHCLCVIHFLSMEWNYCITLVYIQPPRQLQRLRACSPGLRTSSASVLINTCWELERTMEGITSSSVSDLILVYPRHVDRIPVAVTGWGCSHPPPTMSLGVREPERPTGVALTLSVPLASHLYDSHIPRRQAQRVMHNPLPATLKVLRYR